MANKIGVNSPCPCGSGNKYKKCCKATKDAHDRAKRELGRLEPELGSLFKKWETERTIEEKRRLEDEKRIEELKAQGKVKGEKNGLCNRSACQTDRNVIFLNQGTSKYYCDRCAFDINDANQNFHDVKEFLAERGGGDLLCRTDEGISPQEFWDKEINNVLE